MFCTDAQSCFDEVFFDFKLFRSSNFEIVRVTRVSRNKIAKESVAIWFGCFGVTYNRLLNLLWFGWFGQRIFNHFLRDHFKPNK